ncbi:MAG TPA: IS66 family transposase [Lamprocystis sp. (in: g-proteobacteria)]|nr:IS66 family transposase [Lamprocystis sp. (in: g-proteobacteria)]
MSRRKNTRTQRVSVPIARLEAIVERTRTEALPVDEHATLKAAVDTLARLTEELETTTTTLERVRRLIFGPRSETTDTVLGTGKGEQTDATAPSADPSTAPDATDTEPAAARKKKRPGHGRNGADQYPRAPRIPVAHATLKQGDPCPESGCTGRLYVQRQEPAVLVRVTGVAPLQAQVYTLERLRCGLCGTVFTAEPPAGVGASKYDESAAAMIALLKYGCGLPFHRIHRLEQALSIPLPATTQWDVVAAAAPRLAPAVEELAQQAAQGTVFYNDDTTMRILKLTAEARAEALPPGAKAERTGVFTAGVVAETVHGPIVLFKTGPGHAGEHLADILNQRQDPATPIQMSDALARNTPGAHPTQAASCIPHGRRKFVEVHDAFPDEVAFVLETLRPVFHTDQQAQQQGLSPSARLLLHQQESGPRMRALQAWMTAQFETHAVEPNSGLGQAITYMQNHWDKLTLFLRVPGAPLSNNICERALKKAILHRKNSLFYRTLNGAKVGDLFMSLIHTAELHQVEPYDYLVTLLRHAVAVALDPPAWMPWNYTATLARLAADAAPPPD